jgi:hypothetical protein
MPRTGPKLTYANVMSTIAVFCAIGGGSVAVAASLKKDSVGTKQIEKNAVKAPEIATNAVTSKEVAAGAVTDAKLGDVAIGTDDLEDGSVVTGKLADNAVTGAKVNESSLGEVPLAAAAQEANNVLSAVVNADGTLAVSTQPGTTSEKTGVFGGGYNVDFGRNLGGCAAVATLGNNAQNIPNPGEIGTSTFPGSTSVAVQTRDSSGSAADNGFHLIVTC